MEATDEPQVLAISREQGLLRLLKFELRRAGVTLVSARSLGAARESMDDGCFSALVVDTHVLPRTHDETLLPPASVGDDEAIPTILLMGDGWNRAATWKWHVDEYVRLPADASDVAARVLRLVHHSTNTPTPLTVFQNGDLTIDFRSREVTRAGRHIWLGRAEWELLQALGCAGDERMTPDALLEAAWGADYRGDRPMLAAWIRQLRRRIEIDPSDPRIIVGSVATGYRLEASTAHQDDVEVSNAAG